MIAHDVVGAICSEVAERCGPAFPTVLDQPFALTLYSFQQLAERDRIEHLRARQADIEFAVLVSMAMHKPSMLDQQRAAVLSAMRRSAHATRSADQPTATGGDDLIARGLALVARLERDRVLDP